MTSRIPGLPHENLVASCRCGATYLDEEVRVVEPQRIGGKDHPARGLVISQGYVYCKRCGISGARAKTTEEAIANWNILLVGISSSKTE